MSSPARKPAEYADILALPDEVVGEILDGELSVLPRPGPRHAGVASTLTEELGPPFRRGRNGPGGWLLLLEPELHLARDVVVPDLAGWRRERMPALPEGSFFDLGPDWVCEVLSQRTARADRVLKRRIYARERVLHYWLIDPDARTLEVERLDGETYRTMLTGVDEEKVRAEPFEALELDLALLWSP